MKCESNGSHSLNKKNGTNEFRLQASEAKHTFFLHQNFFLYEKLKISYMNEKLL